MKWQTVLFLFIVIYIFYTFEGMQIITLMGLYSSLHKSTSVKMETKKITNLEVIKSPIRKVIVTAMERSNKKKN